MRGLHGAPVARTRVWPVVLRKPGVDTHGSVGSGRAAPRMAGVGVGVGESLQPRSGWTGVLSRAFGRENEIDDICRRNP